MKHSSRGFSLIELIIFIVIVGVAVGAIAAVFSTNVANSPEALLREKTLKIANLYMDEIMGKRWNENTPAGGGCVETGSNYCTNYCAGLAFPDCGFCAKGAGVCVAPDNATVIGAEEGLRSDFDDVDDYNGTVSATPSFPDPAGAGGETALTDVNGYSVSVTVSATALGTVPAADARRIVISVTNPLNETLTLTRFRTNF